MNYFLENQLWPAQIKPKLKGDLPFNIINGTKCLLQTRDDATSWIMFCHGNQDSLEGIYASRLMPALCEKCKCNIIVPEYPMKNKKGAQYDKQVITAFQSAYDYIRTKHSSLPMFVIAHSMGVALALHACKDNPPHGMVLVNGFASIRAFAPSFLSWIIPDRLNNVKVMDRYCQHSACKMHIVYGALDNIIPSFHSRLLFDANKSNSTIECVKGMSHEISSVSLLSKWCNNLHSHTNAYAC